LVNARKLKNYIEKNESKQDNMENEAEMQTSLNYIEEDIFEYLEPERIIGCKRGAQDAKKTWREIYSQEFPKVV
jgi:chromodomain-helicase-DNA-binding protein 3/chromodomain-helicase-DNA-binding protein 4